MQIDARRRILEAEYLRATMAVCDAFRGERFLVTPDAQPGRVGVVGPVVGAEGSRAFVRSPEPRTVLSKLADGRS